MATCGPMRALLVDHASFIITVAEVDDDLAIYISSHLRRPDNGEAATFSDCPNEDVSEVRRFVAST